MSNDSKWLIGLLFFVGYLFTLWAFVALRSENHAIQDNSVECKIRKGVWQQPSGIQPGWCK